MRLPNNQSVVYAEREENAGRETTLGAISRPQSRGTTQSKTRERRRETKVALLLAYTHETQSRRNPEVNE